MYDVLTRLIFNAISQILQSSRSQVIGEEQTRRCNAKRLVEAYEALEVVTKTANELSEAVKYYVENDWASSVAKRMRIDKLIGLSNRLQEDVGELGDKLRYFMICLDATQRERDMLNHLIGIQRAPMGRGQLFGAPQVVPTFSIVATELQDSVFPSVSIHVTAESVLKVNCRRKELKRYLNADPSTLEFIRTTPLDDTVAAGQILSTTCESIESLADVRRDLKAFIQSNLIIDDLLG